MVDNKKNDVVWIASEIAKQAHQGQFRLGPDKLPYIVHPALAAKIVEKLASDDKDVIAAAWLHDVIEDTYLKTEDQFYDAFAKYDYNDKKSIKRIYNFVEELSMPDTVEWNDIRSYQIDKIQDMSEDAKILKIADQVSNYLDGIPVGWSEEKIRGYSFKSADICVACAKEAPYIYKLFKDYQKSSQDLSPNEVSSLINKISEQKKANTPVDLPSIMNDDSCNKSQIASNIIVFYVPNSDQISRLCIDGNDLATTIRKKIEDHGTFAMTLPAEGSKRDLILEEPLSEDVIKNVVI